MTSINLLPKKESRFNTSMIICVFLGVLICGTGVATFLYSKYLNDQIATLDQRYNVYMTQIDALKTPVVEEGTELESKFNDLQLIADELDLYKPYTVELFTKVIGLLPDNGYVMDIEFDRVTSQMRLVERFLNYKEAGYMAARLQKEKWVNEVTLSSISTVELQTQEQQQNGNQKEKKQIRFDAEFLVQVTPSEWKNVKVTPEDTTVEQQNNQSDVAVKEE